MFDMQKKPTKTLFALRLDPEERTRLAQRAADLKVSESELARRYLREGLHMDRHPRITFAPTHEGRPACLATRPRLMVADVIETWLLEDRDVEGTAQYFELDPEDVRAAVAYYADFPEEIDRRLKEKHELAERMERVLDRSRHHA